MARFEILENSKSDYAIIERTSRDPYTSDEYHTLYLAGIEHFARASDICDALNLQYRRGGDLS